jgi:hypothetical protein
MSDKQFYRAASSLSVALEPDNNGDKVYRPLYTDENVLVKPELDSVEFTPSSIYAGAKEKRVISCYAKSNFDIVKSVEPFNSPADFKNSDLNRLLNISHLEETIVTDVERLSMLSYQDGTTIEILFKDELPDTATIPTTMTSGDLVYSKKTETLYIYKDGDFKEYKIEESYSLDVCELEAICQHYMDDTKGGKLTKGSDGTYSDGTSTPFADNTIWTIYYKDSEPAVPSNNIDIWIDTESRVGQKAKDGAWNDSEYIVGYKFQPSTYAKTRGSIIAIDDDTKVYLDGACASLKIESKLDSFLKMTFSLYASYREEEGDFSNEIEEMITPSELLSSCQLSDLKYAKLDNITEGQESLDLDSFEFDNARDFAYMKTFGERSGYHSLDAAPIVTLVGGKDYNFKAYLSELEKQEGKSLSFDARDSNKHSRLKFVSFRTKVNEQDKSEDSNTLKITKKLSLSQKIESGDNRYFNLYIFT